MAWRRGRLTWDGDRSPLRLMPRFGKVGYVDGLTVASGWSGVRSLDFARRLATLSMTNVLSMLLSGGPRLPLLGMTGGVERLRERLHVVAFLKLCA